MEGGWEGGRQRERPLHYLLLSFIRNMDSSLILIWIRVRNQCSRHCQHHNELYFPWGGIHDKAGAAPILIPEVKRNSWQDGLAQEVKIQAKPQGQLCVHDAALGRLSSTSGAQLAVIFSCRGHWRCLETEKVLVPTWGTCYRHLVGRDQGCCYRGGRRALDSSHAHPQRVTTWGATRLQRRQETKLPALPMIRWVEEYSDSLA